MNNRFIALIIVIIVAICEMSAFLLTQETDVDNNITVQTIQLTTPLIIKLILKQETQITKEQLMQME
ncbi:hypothetical protein ALNOE001_14360 [Candidatus Methanobinarius endosymbioticus]|uniref:Uncharacterized protein n=1 Tax=Candidatus Methanobinarius endosymbioticus TaxID=2006182 RepID=A0A366MAX3_9EURY|nr:hypothetical protein ALNOE001_14360 [Candidatus Methanobinarius endosymbioticus]